MHMNNANTMVAQNVRQLLSFDDELFIDCAYNTLLGRSADSVGMEYYLGKLRRGEKKMQILIDLYLSAEGKQHDTKTPGLKSKMLGYFIKRLINLDRRAWKKISTSSNPANNKPIKIIKVPQTQSTYIENKGQPTLWVDLTTVFEWTGGVVGIIRAELEIAYGLAKLANNVRFSMQIENGFVEIQKEQLQWLLQAENVADAYMNFFGRYKKKDSGKKINKNSIRIEVPDTETVYFPFQTGDVVLSVGWMDSQKENFFSKIKEESPSIYIIYLVYDIILLLAQTRHFYHQQGQEKFKNYIKWISHNCDFVLYGGKTAQRDTEALQAEMGWDSPYGAAIKFGTDIMKSVDPMLEKNILTELGITAPFIMTVGSIEPRKNHDTLYRAYLLALEISGNNLPQLVICGKPAWRADDLLDTIDRDPRLRGKILRLTPTDTQLAVLYKRCLFTVLPSLYEGWSLTLPESLGQGKFCLCTDTPPLREIAGDLVDYAPAWDVRAWANKLTLYSQNQQKLNAYEHRISTEWPKLHWHDTARMVYENIQQFIQSIKTEKHLLKIKRASSAYVKPTLWMDITLSFLEWQGNVNGIVRTELNYARYLKKLDPNTRFFAYTDNYFFEVDSGYLLWLFNDSDLSSAYTMFQHYWNTHEAAGTGFRNPFRVTGKPIATHPAYLDQFPENSIVLFVGIDFIKGRKRSRIIDVLKSSGVNRKVLTSQLIYDFTPVLYPQFHVQETCDGYIPFLQHISQRFDHILYGGRTAQRDGIEMQKSRGWPTPPSNYIEFGSNFEKRSTANIEEQQHYDAEILKKFNIDKNFIMTVGTIEPRKNHEMLYKAYITLLNRKDIDITKLPKMLFIGKKGWKTHDFLAVLEADERVKDKIILLTPTDDELDVFYRHCLFTLLPSFYEGWSLTLPESLSYGKFCLTSDVAPLRETGRDLVEYIHPLDTYAWADRIYYYSTRPEILINKEVYIQQNWKPRTWQESTAMLMNAISSAHRSRYYD